MTNKEIGEHVAAFMAERGWDDKQMAEYCEVKPYQVRNTVIGTRCETEAIAKISRKIGLAVPGLTVEGKRKRPPCKAKPNWLRDRVIANGYAWTDVAYEIGLGSTSELGGIGVERSIPPRMLGVFEDFTGLSHEELLNLSLSLCKTDREKTRYLNRYAAHYSSCSEDVIAASKDRAKQRIRIPATIAGIEQEMDRLREEAPANETPEQRTKRIEHLDALWRARRDLRAKAMENAV